MAGEVLTAAIVMLLVLVTLGLQRALPRRQVEVPLAVAAAVAAGRADCGLGVLAAARAFGLDFVQVAREPYDLVMASDTVADPILAPLWALLAEPAFRSAVEELGGYSTSETGRRIR